VESRLRILFLILLTGFLGLGARLFQLQVVEGARYSHMAEQNRIRRVITPAPRGRIFDRNGQLLADSRASFSILLVPAEADSSGVMLLAGILGLPVDDVWSRLERSESQMTPVRLRRNAELDLVAMVEEHSSEIPGVIVKTEPQRDYPLGPVFAHALGYVNEITETQLARDSSYRQGEILGVAGIEAQYESWLRGRDGSKYVVVNAWGQEISELPEREETSPVPGQELHLTLDAALQEKAKELLEPYRKATVVALDLRDGGVVCLYSKPGFDPNLLSGSVSREQWDALINDEETPFVNRATMSVYSPGSTVKPLVALAGLQSKAIDEHTTFQPCNGAFTYGRSRFKCLGRHGRLTLIPAIAQSCNIYFYQLGLRIGIDPLANLMSQFGFGSPTGIDLLTERNGIAPNRAWLDKRYGTSRWSIGIVINLAIGQGEVQVTPLQLADAYAILAGGGEYCTPHLLDYTRTADGLITRARIERRHVAIDQHHLDLVRAGLTGVVAGGTGSAAFVPGINVAGKTGTTEHTGGADHAWFACYAGRTAPEVVIVVLIENGGKGGAIAAPVAGGLIRQYFGVSAPSPVIRDTSAGAASRRMPDSSQSGR
jgi:penicillin-binding protein 2